MPQWEKDNVEQLTPFLPQILEKKRSSIGRLRSWSRRHFFPRTKYVPWTRTKSIKIQTNGI